MRSPAEDAPAGSGREAIRGVEAELKTVLREIGAAGYDRGYDDAAAGRKNAWRRTPHGPSDRGPGDAVEYLREDVTARAYYRGCDDQIRVEPVEERHVEHEVAVLGGEAAPQPHLDPAGGRVVAGVADRRPAARGVAVDVKREGPARRGGHRRGQLPPRRPPAEEPRDLALREPQLLLRHRCRPPFEREHGDVEPRRPYAERHPHVQVVRRPAQQRVDQAGGLSAVQPLHLVEREHPRLAVAFQRPDQQIDPVLGLGCSPPGPAPPRGRRRPGRMPSRRRRWPIR